jgi:hypothetical protein
MAQRTDLYSILVSYAEKRHSPYIDIEPFMLFLEKYVNRFVDETPEWKNWIGNIAVKAWAELNTLIEAGKCRLADENEGKSRLFLTEFFVDQINHAYQAIDKNADIPFPDEKTLGIAIPPEQFRVIALEYDLAPYLEDPEASPDGPPPLIKILFPEGLSSAITLPAFIPRRVLEAAMLKVRYFLRQQNNKDFLLRLLLPQLPGKETTVKEMIRQIDLRPLDCVQNIENTREWALFWPHFCGALKTELKKKVDFIAMEIGALQSAYLIDIFNSFYQTKANRKKEAEQALKALELRLDQAPYLFTMDAILQFTDSKGRSLLGQYSQNDLTAYLNAKATEAAEQKLPELLIFLDKQNRQFFIRKNRLFLYCAQMMGSARTLVRKAIAKRWHKLLGEFRKEPAMNQAPDFERLVTHYANQLVPDLMCLLEDKKIFLVQKELEAGQAVIPNFPVIYSREGMLPLDVLLMLKRKEILTDVRILLPFWCTVPIISSLIFFFKSLGKAPRDPETLQNPEEGKEAPARSAPTQQRSGQTSTAQLEAKLVPEGSTLDDSLTAMEGHWHRIMDQKTRAQLVRDIHALIRDKLRRLLQLEGKRKLTENSLRALAEAIIQESPSLLQLDTQESIRLYIQLSTIKVLK